LKKSISQDFALRVSVDPVGDDSQGSENQHDDPNIDALYNQICNRQQLSNGSFRYQSAELETFNRIYTELAAKKPGRISKNDLARMAMIVLCQDFDDNGEESIIAQVFKRM